MRRAHIWRGGVSGLWFVDRFAPMGLIHSTTESTHAEAVRVADDWVNHRERYS